MAARLSVLKKYIVLKGQSTVIAAELREIRPEVVELLETMPDKQVEVGGKIICLTTKQRKTFDVKAAQKKIAKLLAPFFKIKEYSEISILGDLDEENDE